MVFSHNRRACISYQRNLKRFENIKSYSSNSAVSNLSPTQLHANLIFQHWKSKEMKHIYSNRLGGTTLDFSLSVTFSFEIRRECL
ncbi:hypothetical protein GLOIN_2v1886499 [Rhizophagus irregularis DAOM 181602=DAOM 197198]|nr:hypothetical protein GLOIN_2v1886499 [Rhizophagus irregularis DAOM 181602=DAOM 197198]